MNIFHGCFDIMTRTSIRTGSWAWTTRSCSTTLSSTTRFARQRLQRGDRSRRRRRRRICKRGFLIKEFSNILRIPRSIPSRCNFNILTQNFPFRIFSFHAGSKGNLLYLEETRMLLDSFWLLWPSALLDHHDGLCKHKLSFSPPSLLLESSLESFSLTKQLCDYRQAERVWT